MNNFNKCIYLKSKSKKQDNSNYRKQYLYCKKHNKIIDWNECKSCSFKEYKQSNNTQIKRSALKRKSSELAKLERNRFSLFSSDNTKCYICESKSSLTWHEIYAGRNRSNSMKYGLCLRLCIKCHDLKQEDSSFNELWHQKGQEMFSIAYPHLDFLKIFRKDYLA